LLGAKKPHGTTQKLYGFGIIRWTVVNAKHVPARSFAAARGGWMSDNILLAGEGKSVFS
jgi:hypothetical protein